MDSSFRIDLLGEPEVTLAGKPANLGQPLQRSVLTVLAVRWPRPVTMSEIVSALWGDDAPANARGSVHTYINALRGVLEPGRTRRTLSSLLVTTPAGYALKVPPGSIDIDRFAEHRDHARQLREAGDWVGAARELELALGLWRGAPLSGVPGPFAEGQRLRLTEAKIAALVEWSEAVLETGRPADVVAELSSEVAEHPLQEQLTSQLMLAFYRCGRQADALAAFHRVRHALADELGVDPGPGLRHLYDRILNSDPTLMKTAEVPAFRSHVRPAQTPHDVVGFVGRGRELAQLREKLVPRSEPDVRPVIISAIDGAGGIGKTALAVRVAHDIAEEFPDGQLYINLNGFDPTHSPVDPAAALAHLLRGLGVEPAQLPDALAERASLYRSVVADRRILILLDNAVDSDQVRPLLPGTSTCRVVVTSRNRLSGLVVADGAYRVTLDVLSDVDAVALLRGAIGADRVDAEPGATRELARLCGHFPLALRIAAERVAAHPHLTVGDLARDLSDERDRLDLLEADETTAVRATFSWSYEALKPAMARMFRLLGLHPGTEISLAAAAAISGTPLGVTRRLVEALCARHLIEAQGHLRYRFHDLVRTYAAEQAEQDESDEQRDAAVNRILRWYLITADNADRTIPMGQARRFDVRLEPPEGCHPTEFHDYDRAITWLETERANLTSVTQYASSGKYKDFAWRVPLASRNFYYLKSYVDEFMAMSHLGLDAAHAVGDGDTEGAICNIIGWIHLRRRRYAESQPWFERALTRWRATGNSYGESVALHNLGVSYAENSEHWAKAEGCYRQALQWRTSIALKCDLGSLYRKMGRFEEAIGCLTQAVSNATEQEEWGKAVALRMLGEVYVEVGDLDRAMDHYRQGLAIFRQYGAGLDEAFILAKIAKILDMQGDREGTTTAALGALEIFDSANDQAEDFRKELIPLLRI